MEKNKKIGPVIIAGGGTGGHIYPAISIARALQKKHPNIEIHFVGAIGGLEAVIVPREGFSLHLLHVGKLHSSVGIATQLRTLLLLPAAFVRCIFLCLRLNPTAVLGVGGYASGPMLLISALLGYRTLIWEPNAFPGLTNRWLARFVDQALVVFPSALKLLKSRQKQAVGLPVRESMRAIASSSQGNLKILVTGGSQGARGINEAISQAVERGGAWLDGVEIVHQTGKLDFAKVKERYKNTPSDRFQVLEYMHDMDQRFAWASVIFCRAGASTVAEVCACHKAAVFIPLPTAADDHQRKNAESLVEKHAAEMILQKEFNADSFIAAVMRFKLNRKYLMELGERAGQFHNPKAADQIVDLILSAAPSTVSAQ